MKPAKDSLLQHARAAFAAAAWLLLAFAAPASAGVTEINNAPLFTSSAAAVKPNIMFILDDSGSMKSDYLPDEASKFSSRYGRKAAQCNGVAYDPTIVYTLPVDYQGNSLVKGTLTFNTNPATQTDNQRTLGSAIVTMPAVGASITVAPQGNRPRSSWYDVGDIVTVFQDSTNFFVGTVTSWNNSTRALKITVTSAVGTTMPSPKIGDGEPLTAVYYKYTGSQPQLGYKYLSNGNVDTNSTFYKECNSYIGSTPGSSVFTAVSVFSNSAEAQNYANWYTYYRTRMTMMKSSVSLAFKNIDDRYRLGYSTISEESVTEGDNFLDIRTFDATQKQKFYTALNKAQPISWTALRAALAKAGQYYAKKAPGQTYDPVQYSCQRNFTILSTDGYWNTPDETSTYGPYKLDGSLVGQQDGGTTKRPMYDGGSITETATETWTVSVPVTTTTITPTSTTTVVTTSTTTQVPQSSTAGSKRTTYTLVGSFGVGGGSMKRSLGSSTVTVTETGHGLVTGDVIDVSGGDYNSFRANNVTVTVLDADHFTYTASSGSTTSASGNYGFYPGGTSCSSGKKVQRSYTQTSDNVKVTTDYATVTTTVSGTVTTVVQKTEVTPYTQVIKVTNGATVSDSGPIPGNVTYTAGSSTTTTQLGTPVTTPGTKPSTSSNTTTPWVTIATSNVDSNCRSSASSDVVQNNLAPTTSTVTTLGGPQTTGPTANNLTPIVTTTRGDPVESGHERNVSQSPSGGSSNSLADVAMYYYQTDLRDTSLGNCTGGTLPNGTTTDVCTDNVPGETADAAHSFGDSNPKQHMTTFTLGLGLSGLLNYDAQYMSQQAGSFYDILSNGKNWPIPGDGQTAENIDDLWHAAVNGRGQYFSAGDPGTLSRSLNAALDSIKQITGAASAASTSSLQPVEGDNDIYVAQFTTSLWVGDVLSYKIDPTTGTISKTSTWSAKAELDKATPSARKIYYPKGTLKAFTYANLVSDGFGGLFDNFCSVHASQGDTVQPQQCDTLDPATDLVSANSGANLVSFLRGDNSMNYYRQRANRLGDIINASPLFIGKPAFKYTENDYAKFASDNANRAAVVLAASNDGMLHAFDRATGDEEWAFIPSFVMPNLYKLADSGYANAHRFYVDGSPQIGDIFVDDGDGSGPHWKTIVVGGLNAGGRGYYALDVTNPVAPKLMWEFKHDDLGLSYGNPIITKRKDGTWVVVFASGYNNVSPGDGNGHLFVVDANTGGTPLLDIKTFTAGTTPAGTSADPSGLAKINSWVDSEFINTSERFYGGDMLGNLWRFDIDGKVDPKGKALLLAQMTGPDGSAQPITVKPALAEVSYNANRYPVVFVPTGRYLGTSDLTDTRKQSVYAIKDPLADLGYGVVRSNPLFVTQTIAAAGNTRTSSNELVDWSTKAGWRVDLPAAGERVSVNPQLALETLFVGSNVPASDACTVGGNSFLYTFNIVNGVSSALYIGNVLIQGLTVVQLTTGAGAGALDTIITRSDGSLDTKVDSQTASAAGLRRTSWRELAD